jgi:hypothetical protein
MPTAVLGSQSTLLDHNIPRLYVESKRKVEILASTTYCHPFPTFRAIFVLLFSTFS